MDFKKLINQMDDDFRNMVEQYKFEIEQSIWNTRKYLQEKSLTISQKNKAKEACFELIEKVKEEFENIDDDLVKEFVTYLESCKTKIDKLFR